ncbi:MAG: hypothetical protein ACM3II_10740 [Rhodospirillaceae bacterium]
MTMRSITTAVAAMLVFSASLPAMAQSQVQAVPRSGVSFPNTVTVRGWIESTDSETHTVVFTTPQGRLIECAVADSVKNLDAIADGTPADVTYNEVVTLLNLRQKGPGSREARKEGAKPDSMDVESGRLTYTVTAVDLANNKVSVIDGRGGPIRTYAATSIAKKDMLKKIKVGDVVIGLTTPLLVTAITPVKQ